MQEILRGELRREIERILQRAKTPLSRNEIFLNCETADTIDNVSKTLYTMAKAGEVQKHDIDCPPGKNGKKPAGWAWIRTQNKDDSSTEVEKQEQPLCLTCGCKLDPLDDKDQCHECASRTMETYEDMVLTEINALQERGIPNAAQHATRLRALAIHREMFGPSVAAWLFELADLLHKPPFPNGFRTPE